MTDIPQDNPQQSTDDLRSQLMAEVYANDRGDTDAPKETSGAQTDEAGKIDEGTRAAESSTEKADNTSSPETSAEKKERLRDEHGKFAKQEAAKPETSEQPENEQKAESKYAKAVKDEQRLARNRQEFEAEKAKWRQDYEARMERVEQLSKDMLANRSERPATHRFQSAQYNQAADEFAKRGRQFYKDGDIEQGDAQFELASQAREQAGQAQQAEQQDAQGKFNSEWQSQANAVIKEVPELGDPNSDISKEMLQLLEQNPLLGVASDGFRRAHEILTLRRQAAKASGLEEENTKLKQQVEELTRKTTPLGGKDTAQHSSPKRDETLDEMRARLSRDVQLSDAA